MSLEQSRIDTVESKINAISESIEQLNQSVGEMKSGLEAIRQDKSVATVAPKRVAGIAENYADFTSSRIGRSADGERYHKDILEDVEDWSAQDKEDGPGLSPEIQIQRLTAQLTAAYSRIAALEEQLLSRRIH